MQNTKNDPTTVTGAEARAGRIVKGGAVYRVLWISLVLAVGGMLLAYLFVWS